MTTQANNDGQLRPHENDWYSERRSRWKPDRVRLLLIAESAPDAGGDPSKRRFFYDDDLTRHDGLFREVCRVLFTEPTLVSGPGKKLPYLEILRARGVYLIDLAPAPVNYLDDHARRETLKANIHATVEAAVELNPEGVVLCKMNVFELLAEPLRDAGVRLLHDEPIPFPGSGQQARFRQAFRDAVISLGLVENGD